MSRRFTDADVETWRREGVVKLPGYFTADEISAVTRDFELVFADRAGAPQALVKKKAGEIGEFNPNQLRNFENIPFNCSPALNLLCVHPELLTFARAALKTQDIQLYQSQAWAKINNDGVTLNCSQFIRREN